MDFSWLFIIVQLIFLEGLLSIDNAAVLGAMVAPLPNFDPVPWPTWLAWLGHRLDPILGGQQDAALKVGLLGAYAGRGLMLMVAHYIVRYPWLQLVGGAYLIYLAIEHLGLSEGAGVDGGDEAGHSAATPARAPEFWHVVLMVEMADLVFSLDNVVAAVALADHISVVLIGVALGILALRWAATYFALMVEKEPVLEYAAYVLVLVIGLRFCIEQVVDVEIPPTLQFVISLSILGLALLYAHWSPLKSLHPAVNQIRRVLFVGLETTKQVLSLRWMRAGGVQ